ncbi:hypothetical protein J8Z83_01590 [Yersinia enterocolitica]|uniref:hypothetical protein n=1 Tax=Yersinia enterocolitica TaxID=630 RepID=UPI001C8EFA56|nr:hypothetical protein [Yersinia enterocolitica]MBX9473413.1 hypothetical protein [Yersinia enterocolitica]
MSPNLTKSDDYSYKRYDSVDDFLSMPNADKLIQKGDFFKDRETINFSLEQAKENESFNAVMIEKAYSTVKRDNIYTKNPVLNQIDEVNIIARKASKFLQEEIDKGNPNYVTAGSILDQLIVIDLKDVSASDINNSDWVAKNPLTKAMKFCIGDNHNQADINAVISDRVIQYYQYKMEAQSSLDLDNYVKKLTDALIFTVSTYNANQVTPENQVSLYRELSEIGNKPSSHRGDANYI